MDDLPKPTASTRSDATPGRRCRKVVAPSEGSMSLLSTICRKTPPLAASMSSPAAVSDAPSTMGTTIQGSATDRAAALVEAPPAEEKEKPAKAKKGKEEAGEPIQETKPAKGKKAKAAEEEPAADEGKKGKKEKKKGK